MGCTELGPCNVMHSPGQGLALMVLVCYNNKYEYRINMQNFLKSSFALQIWSCLFRSLRFKKERNV